MCLEQIGGTVFYEKREQVPQPHTNSDYQVRIPLKNKRSVYQSYSISRKDKHISSRYLNI